MVAHGRRATATELKNGEAGVVVSFVWEGRGGVAVGVYGGLGEAEGGQVGNMGREQAALQLCSSSGNCPAAKTSPVRPVLQCGVNRA